MFIKEIAVFHAQSVEDWDYEYFELETFRKIIEFAADEQDIAFETFSKKLLMHLKMILNQTFTVSL